MALALTVPLLASCTARIDYASQIKDSGIEKANKVGIELTLNDDKKEISPTKD